MNDIADEAEQAFRRDEKPAERLKEYQLEQQAIRLNYRDSAVSGESVKRSSNPIFCDHKHSKGKRL